MSDAINPSEVFPAWEYLREELESRGWSITEFADIIGRPLQAVSEILNGRKEITAETAAEIGAAFGTSPNVWLDLQSAYRLWIAGTREHLTKVEWLGRLRSRVPLAEIRKLGWIPVTDNLDVTEAAVCKLLRVSDLSEALPWTIAARRSNVEAALIPAQQAWLARVADRAGKRHVGSYSQKQLKKTGMELAARLAEPSRLAEIRSWLAEVGVIVAVVPHLQGSKIDGAALRLETGTPVIGLSLRGNRFDSVVYTLLHEIAHIVLGHVDHAMATVDEDLGADHGGTGNEAAADQLAQSWLFPHGLDITDPVSGRKIVDAAHVLRVHPSLIVGRLQHDGRLPWSSLRPLIPKAKDLLAFDD